MDLEHKIYDVAIIGAGPAGSFLAYLLAQSGIKVTLIDKEKFPRKKVCGGGLTDKVLNILSFDISSIIEKEIRQLTLSYGLKTEFTKNYQKPLIYSIKREVFDHFLVQKSKSCGAEFLDSQGAINLKFEDGYWTIETTLSSLKAKIIVGADGANSFIAKTIGLNPIDIWSMGIQVEIPGQYDKKYKFIENNGAFLDFNSIKNCYGWIFPKHDEFFAGVAGPMALGRKLKPYLFKIIKYLGLENENFNLTAHLIASRISNKFITGHNAILVGEAAGLTDPWTGEGIFYALKSSQIAAQHIKKFFSGNSNAIGDYEISVNQEIVPEFKASHYLSKIFGPIFPLFLKIIKRYKYPWDVFCRVMRGERTFLELKKRFRPDILLRKILFKNSHSV